MLQGIAVTLSRLKEICARDEQDPGRVITVIDGEGRGPACVGELVKAGVHFVTRSDERRILDDSELRHRLNEAEWFLVPDSGSGPARYAIDIGERVMPVTDEAGDLREVTVRLVLTRHRSKRCSKRAGRTIGSYHYELFATQLPRDAFGPEDIVNL
jgi:transcription elongation factor